MKGLPLNYVIWIRDDWWLLEWSMPDKCNDEVQCSFVVRDSPNKMSINGLRRGAFKLSYILYLIDITIIIAYSFFLLTGAI
jgi:hypothetical protein